MSDPVPLTSTVESLPSEAVQQGWFNRQIVAVLLSMVIPGSGQIVLGRRRVGAILFGLFLLLLFGIWPLRLPRFYVAFILLVLCADALTIYASYNAVVSISLGQRRLSRTWLLLVIPLSVVVLNYVLVFPLRASGFRLFLIPTTSMEDSIMQGDDIMADFRYFSESSPKRQQIVIYESDKILIVKRVIAIGGDIIAGDNGNIFLNGTVLNEPYIKHTGSPPWDMTHFGPIIVSPGSYFVMGDNRDVSYDSRQPSLGCIRRESIVGAPLYRFGKDRRIHSLH